MAKRKHPLHPDAPLLHLNHPRPVTRRDFLRQGFLSGMGMTIGGSVLGLFAHPRHALADNPDLSQDINDLANAIACSLGGGTLNPLPVICFDLAGGANIAGSNVLVGRSTQMDFLSTAGYSKLGLPGDMIPGLPEATPTATGNADHTDTTYGLAFHTDSSFLRGMLEKAPTRGALTNGIVIPARSENDTGNNPHNPMYGLAAAGADGGVVTLIGSRNSESGGNSMPALPINPEIRPTKVDRPSDVTGMVDTGDLTAVLKTKEDVVAVMESIARLSDKKLNRVDTKLGITADAVVKDLVRCGYLKSADLAARFADRDINPATDSLIVDDATGIFTTDEFNNDKRAVPHHG